MLLACKFRLQLVRSGHSTSRSEIGPALLQALAPYKDAQMTRGNQREVDRKRAAARAAKGAAGKKEDGLTPQQRNER
jgi:hypothetical protein